MTKVLLATVVLASLILAVSFSGCIAPGATYYILEFQLVDLDPSVESKGGWPGEHCKSVEKTDDTLTLTIRSRKQMPNTLVVFPSFPEGWWVSDAAPYHRPLPTTVHAGVADGPTRIGTFAEAHDGRINVNGEDVILPYSWTITSDRDTWIAYARLSAWDGKVELDRVDWYCD